MRETACFSTLLPSSTEARIRNSRSPSLTIRLGSRGVPPSGGTTIETCPVWAWPAEACGGPADRQPPQKTPT